MNVELIAHTPDPEAAVAAAARLCYSDWGAVDLKKGMSREEISSLLKRLISMGHLSPVEHASFTFAIDGVSRSLSHQLVRHRIASYSQKSQRYVNRHDPHRNCFSRDPHFFSGLLAVPPGIFTSPFSYSFYYLNPSKKTALLRIGYPI
jgi:flavin-dependent thymidylate synthase